MRYFVWLFEFHLDPVSNTKYVLLTPNSSIKTVKNILACRLRTVLYFLRFFAMFSAHFKIAVFFNYTFVCPKYVFCVTK